MPIDHYNNNIFLAMKEMAKYEGRLFINGELIPAVGGASFQLKVFKTCILQIIFQLTEHPESYDG